VNKEGDAAEVLEWADSGAGPVRGENNAGCRSNAQR